MECFETNLPPSSPSIYINWMFENEIEYLLSFLTSFILKRYINPLQCNYMELYYIEQIYFHHPEQYRHCHRSVMSNQKCFEREFRDILFWHYSMSVQVCNFSVESFLFRETGRADIFHTEKNMKIHWNLPPAIK